MTDRLFLAVPSYRPTREMHDELEELASSLGQDTIVSIMERCSIIEMARATLEERFLDSPCTHILWRDDDVLVQPHDVAHMLEEGLDIVGLGCRSRHTGGRVFNIRALHHGHGDFTPRVLVGSTGRRLIQAAGIGFGCVLVRRNVVERLWRKHPELHCESLENPGKDACMTFLPTLVRGLDGTRRFCGEDLSWCDRARASGFRIHVLLGAQTDHAGLVDALDDDCLQVAPVQPLNRATRRALEARRGA